MSNLSKRYIDIAETNTHVHGIVYKVTVGVVPQSNDCGSGNIRVPDSFIIVVPDVEDANNILRGLSLLTENEDVNIKDIKASTYPVKDIDPRINIIDINMYAPYHLVKRLAICEYLMAHPDRNQPGLEVSAVERIGRSNAVFTLYDVLNECDVKMVDGRIYE